MSGKFVVITKKGVLCMLFAVSMVIIMCITGLNTIEGVIETSNKNRLLPIYSVETEKKEVALTFDCAWGADDISSIVDTLKLNGVEATFFVVGDWVKKYPDAVELLNNANMEIRKSYF